MTTYSTNTITTNTEHVYRLQFTFINYFSNLKKISFIDFLLQMSFYFTKQILF